MNIGCRPHMLSGLYMVPRFLRVISKVACLRQFEKAPKMLPETTYPCDFLPNVRLGTAERLGKINGTTTRYAINYKTLLSTNGLGVWFSRVFTSLGVFGTSPVSRWLL